MPEDCPTRREQKLSPETSQYQHTQPSSVKVTDDAQNMENYVVLFLAQMYSERHCQPFIHGIYAFP